VIPALDTKLNRAYTRGDRRRDGRGNDGRDSRLVYTLQATGRRDVRSDSRGDDRPVYTPYNAVFIVK